MLKNEWPQLTIVLQDVQNFHEFSIVLSRVIQFAQNHLFFLCSQLPAISMTLTASFASTTCITQILISHTKISCISAHLLTWWPWTCWIVFFFIIVVLIAIKLARLPRCLSLMLLLLHCSLHNHILNRDRWCLVILSRRLDRTFFTKVTIQKWVLLVWRKRRMLPITSNCSLILRLSDTLSGVCWFLLGFSWFHRSQSQTICAKNGLNCIYFEFKFTK